MALVLHLYNPAVRPADQVPTWDALVSEKWDEGTGVKHIACRQVWDMADALMYHWPLVADLVTCEQDMGITKTAVDGLLKCKHGFCAWDYELGPSGLWSQLPDGSGLGLAKLGYHARMAVTEHPPVPRMSWRDVAGVLWQRMGPAHVHRPPVAHHHTYET